MKRPWDAIAWWGKRRIPFNLAVLTAGVASILVIEFVGDHFAKSGEDLEKPIGILIGVISYAVAANLCYSLGWITGLLWSWGDTTLAEAFRPKIFRLGSIFSIVLTLLPSILLPLVWAIWGFK
jgi:hypothetical protein